MVKEQIVGELKKILKELGIEDIEPRLEQPQDPSHGDYSSNIALVLSKKLKKSPIEIAKEIEKKFTSHDSSVFTVETVSPGFINFKLSAHYLSDQLKELLSGTKKVANSTQLDKKKVMIEFTDPNPFKEFHIGHLYSNIVGEAISRLFEASGAQVQRVNYQGDVGLHVAKAIWGIMNQELGIKDLEKVSLKEKVKILGEAYVKGSKAYEEDQSEKQTIHDLNKKIYEIKGDVIASAAKQSQEITTSTASPRDDALKDLYHKGRQWSLDYFEEIYKRLGTTFAHYYFESEVGKKGVELVRQHIKDGIFEESEGAVIFPGKKHGLHNRVFINSLGLPTYEAKELGLAFTKYDDFSYDSSLIVTGNEIKEYFKVLLKVLFLIAPELAAKTRHVPHGMVRLPSGKMSSRTGGVITGEWLLDEAKKNILEQYKDMDKDTAELVAIGAVKYALLKSNIGGDITFDFHESINLQGNSGTYLQYTYVRTQSVIRKAEARDWNLEAGSKEIQQEKEETELLRLLVKFDEVIDLARQHTSPHLLCNYLFEVAQAFNLFYQKHKILSSVIPNSFRDLSPAGESVDNSNEMLKPVQHDKTTSFRLALTAGAGKVLKEGLNLLGIEAPERM